MFFPRITDVYTCIHKTLREDSVIRKCMGLNNIPTDMENDMHIQKRMSPKEALSTQLPLIAFYKSFVKKERNHNTHVVTFDFDIYTNDDVELALDLADRINHLFDNQSIQLLKGVFSKGQYVGSAEVVSEIEHSYKYFTRFEFIFEIEGCS
ncbi:hypothetical protein ACFVWC_29175 [Bacillus mycoides]|uniref:hypothetical protein n=1 Tax=Bacillus mycoides TaxID=1405 RepID=UPI0036E7AC47